MPERGTHVVVEQTAAEFFEGQVLSSTHDTLRVQTTSGGEIRRVSVDDAYVLPPSAHAFQPGDLAICRAAAGRWVACRVVHASSVAVEAVDPDGNTLHLQDSGLVAPTPVTVMNLRRRFERERERVSFTQAAEHAGHPVAPPGWHAAAHERILARRGGQWYSADVREIDHDTLHVVWRSDQRESEVAAKRVAPEPPYDGTVHSGDFVLIRPSSLATPWRPWRVDTAADGAYGVVDVDGKRRTVGPRDVVPLRP